MLLKWLPAAIILGALVCAPAKADVTYTFFDGAHPEMVDLEFTVATQLSPTETPEQLLSVGGAYDADFAVDAPTIYKSRLSIYLRFCSLPPSPGTRFRLRVVSRSLAIRMAIRRMARPGTASFLGTGLSCPLTAGLQA